VQPYVCDRDFGVAGALSARTRYCTVRDGSMHATGQCTLTNIKTVAQFEAIEPRTIAIIAILSSVEFYRP
jgi:hypothetical protein